MPVTSPLTSDVNLTPTSVAAVSLLFAVLGFAVAGQIVHVVHPNGETGVDAVEAGLVPTALVAVTLKV